ncbi:hypothetical protein AcV5_003386 [Taiwanofungus camphoratus]|nr:hypothetical protein AcV5_003386 [Antrodia cinnamomea]
MWPGAVGRRGRFSRRAEVGAGAAPADERAGGVDMYFDSRNGDGAKGHGTICITSWFSTQIALASRRGARAAGQQQQQHTMYERELSETPHPIVHVVAAEHSVSRGLMGT